jgi:hypothetical protein
MTETDYLLSQAIGNMRAAVACLSMAKDNLDCRTQSFPLTQMCIVNAIKGVNDAIALAYANLPQLKESTCPTTT